jgi:hypothetical protein
MTSALSYAAWIVLALATAVLWVRACQPGSPSAPPAVVLRRVAGDPALRVVLVAGWAFAGWHLFAR